MIWTRQLLVTTIMTAFISGGCSEGTSDPTVIEWPASDRTQERVGIATWRMEGTTERIVHGLDDSGAQVRFRARVRGLGDEHIVLDVEVPNAYHAEFRSNQWIAGSQVMPADVKLALVLSGVDAYSAADARRGGAEIRPRDLLDRQRPLLEGEAEGEGLLSLRRQDLLVEMCALRNSALVPPPTPATPERSWGSLVNGTTATDVDSCEVLRRLDEPSTSVWSAESPVSLDSGPFAGLSEFPFDFTEPVDVFSRNGWSRTPIKWTNASSPCPSKGLLGFNVGDDNRYPGGSAIETGVCRVKPKLNLSHVSLGCCWPIKLR